MRLFRPAEGPLWLEPILASIEQAMAQRWDSPVLLQSFTVASLPSAASWTGGIVYVSNEAGGATVAFSDGTNWRRAADRAIVS